jgi:hypothetical protein
MFRSTGPVAMINTLLTWGCTWTVEGGSSPYQRDSNGDCSSGDEEEICEGVCKVESSVNTHCVKFVEVETSVIPRLLSSLKERRPASKECVEVDQAKDSIQKARGTSVTDRLRHRQVSKKASVEVTKWVDDYKERNGIIIPIISHCKLLSLAKKCERGVFCYWEMNKRVCACR